MITEQTKIVSDRDIRKKCNHSNYNIIDIKAGEPFYPRRVNNQSWLEQKTITVPAFAATWNEYPIEWFSIYNSATTGDRGEE